MKDRIKIAIAGVENCASSLLRGIEYYRKKRTRICSALCIGSSEATCLISHSAYFMKHPPEQYPDDEAYRMTEEFIAGNLYLGYNCKRALKNLKTKVNLRSGFPENFSLRNLSGKFEA